MQVHVKSVEARSNGRGSGHNRELLPHGHCIADDFPGETSAISVEARRYRDRTQLATPDNSLWDQRLFG